MATRILHSAATAIASEAHPDIYNQASSVSRIFCEFLNELFQCSGDSNFEHIPIRSYSEMMADAGLIKVNEGRVSLTSLGEAVANEVGDAVRRLDEKEQK
jgi:predicted methyltransferase